MKDINNYKRCVHLCDHTLIDSNYDEGLFRCTICLLTAPAEYFHTKITEHSKWGLCIDCYNLYLALDSISKEIPKHFDQKFFEHAYISDDNYVTDKKCIYKIIKNMKQTAKRILSRRNITIEFVDNDLIFRKGEITMSTYGNFYTIARKEEIDIYDKPLVALDEIQADLDNEEDWLFKIDIEDDYDGVGECYHYILELLPKFRNMVESQSHRIKTLYDVIDSVAAYNYHNRELLDQYAEQVDIIDTIISIIVHKYYYELSQHHVKCGCNIPEYAVVDSHKFIVREV